MRGVVVEVEDARLGAWLNDERYASEMVAMKATANIAAMVLLLKQCRLYLRASNLSSLT